MCTSVSLVLEGVVCTPINWYIFILAQVVQKCPGVKHMRMRNSVDSLLLIKKTQTIKGLSDMKYLLNDTCVQSWA